MVKEQDKLGKKSDDYKMYFGPLKVLVSNIQLYMIISLWLDCFSVRLSRLFSWEKLVPEFLYPEFLPCSSEKFRLFNVESHLCSHHHVIWSTVGQVGNMNEDITSRNEAVGSLVFCLFGLPGCFFRSSLPTSCLFAPFWREGGPSTEVRDFEDSEGFERVNHF